MATANPYTPKQRKSLHKYCELLANALNDAGLDQRVVLKPSIEIPWDKESVKQQLYKPILKAMTGEESTEGQKTVDVGAVYEVLNRHTSSKLGVSVPFPDRFGVQNYENN